MKKKLLEKLNLYSTSSGRSHVKDRDLQFYEYSKHLQENDQDTFSVSSQDLVTIKKLMAHLHNKK